MQPLWQVERLTGEDVAAGLALSTEVGWNQTVGDWNYLLAAGQGFGVRAGGQLVATSLALPYLPSFGWVSMVLVTGPFRRQGLATLLLREAVDHLLRLGLVPMLDATPEGREVYLRLGFVDVERIDRWQGVGAGQDVSRAIERAALDSQAALDLSAFGASRMQLLADLASRDGCAFACDDDGFAATRRGRLSLQIGPVVARTSAGGARLLRQLLDGATGPVIADVPHASEAVGDELSRAGFTVARRFHRMAYRQTEGFGDRTLVQVIAGPELG